jgi:iron complex outermembrane receptor protein
MIHANCWLRPVAVLGAALMVLPTSDLLAQQDQGLEEIVVTARKREESMMEVPIAITAFTSAELEARDLVELKDLQLYTPSFSFTHMQGGSARNDRSSNALVFRGLNLSNNVGITAGGQLFIDGAPVIGAYQPSTVDAERVEILKGPQSAYFGRSTFVGALNFVMKEPGDEFAGSAGIEYSPTFGSNEQYLSLEGPITDNLALRVSGRHWEQGGYITNFANPSVKLGQRDTNSASLNLVWTPTENVKVKTFLNYFRDEDGPAAQFGLQNAPPQLGGGIFPSQLNGIPYPDGTCDPLGSPLRPGFEDQAGQRWTFGYICGELPSASEVPYSIFSMDESLDPILRQTLFDPNPNWVIFDPSWHTKHGLKREGYQGHIRIDWEFGDGYTFTSLTAAHQDKSQNIIDLNYRDGRQVPNTAFGVCSFLNGADRCRPDWNTTLLIQGDQEDFSQEFRITSPQDRRFRWTAGFNYFDAHSPGGTVYGNLMLGPFFTAAIVERDVETPAVFGAAYFDLTDKLTLTAEARYQRDEITEEIIIGVNQLPPENPEVLSGTFNSFAPRVSLDFKYSEDSTIYVLFSRGFRPGRFNGVLNNAPQPVLDALLAVAPDASVQVDEEQLDNYELGVKSTWLDGRARTTVAVYYDEWIDGQVSNSIPIQVGGVANLIGVTLNNGKATLTGLEFEGSWAITDNFTLSGSLGLNDTEIDAYQCGDCNEVYGTFDGVEGNELPSAPRLTYSISGQYTDQLNLKAFESGNWEWFGRFDWAHQGSRYVDYSNVAETAAYDNLNLRFGVRSDNLNIEAFLLNATDEDEFIAGFRGINVFSFTGFGGPNQNMIRVAAPMPRSWGIRATYNF